MSTAPATSYCVGCVRGAWCARPCSRSLRVRLEGFVIPTAERSPTGGRAESGDGAAGTACRAGAQAAGGGGAR